MKKPKDDLSPENRRKVEEAMRDSRDRTRWVIANPMFGKRCWLLWRASDDCSLMYWTRKRPGRPKPELTADSVTLFKRREHAAAMLKHLRKTRKSARENLLLRCRVGEDGKTVHGPLKTDDT